MNLVTKNIKEIAETFFVKAFYPPMIFPQSHGTLGDQLKECPLSSSALPLPRCKMWWFLSPGTTCWR